VLGNKQEDVPQFEVEKNKEGELKKKKEKRNINIR
jgi:hypothetical protein